MGEKRKISKAKGIEICVERLEKGKRRPEILQEFAELYNLSESAIDKWLRQARKIVEDRQKEAESIRLMHVDANISEAVKEGLLSDMEIELILCKIISGELQIEEWVKGTAILREVTPTEITNAAKVVYAKRGSNAPEKKEISGKINLTDEPLIFD